MALLNATAVLLYPQAGFQSAAGEPFAANISVAGASLRTSLELYTLMLDLLLWAVLRGQRHEAHSL